MTVQSIVLYPETVLRTRAAEVTEFDDRLGALVDDLLETMKAHGGAGIAANQIGSLARVFAFDCGGHYGHIVNPVWEAVGDAEQTGPEGCLSIPGIRADTTRYDTVTVRGFDRDGQPVEITADDIMARCIQHETDHLDGVLFLQRLDPDTRKAAMRAVRETAWYTQSLAATDNPGQYPVDYVNQDQAAPGVNQDQAAPGANQEN